MGVPQRRERVFFICLRKDLACPFLHFADMFTELPEIEMEFDGTLRRQRHQLECFEAYYEIYKKHFGDLIDHRISDKISMLGGCLGCLFISICESTMEIDEMSTTMEKYIRLQVKTMKAIYRREE